jgi:hypothetical protein
MINFHAHSSKFIVQYTFSDTGIGISPSLSTFKGFKVPGNESCFPNGTSQTMFEPKDDTAFNRRSLSKMPAEFLFAIFDFSDLSVTFFVCMTISNKNLIKKLFI